MTERRSCLPRDLVLVGDIEGAEDLFISGEVHGQVDVEGVVTIERDGVVRGNVRAQELRIAGSLSGDASAGQTIRVEATGAVIGDLRAPAVQVVKGARFRGHVHMPKIAQALVSDAAAPEVPRSEPPPRALIERDAGPRVAHEPRATPRVSRSEAATLAGSTPALESNPRAVGSRGRPPAPLMPRLSRSRARFRDRPSRDN